MKRINLLFLLACISLIILACGEGSDDKPPTVPQGLTATGVSTTQMELHWQPSGGKPRGYEIFRDGKYLATIPMTGMVDSGLAPATYYCYAVLSYDKEGNRSKLSETVCESTPLVNDTSPPTTPANFTATVVNSSVIDLSWDPSSDNVGVAGYDIERDGAWITAVIVNSYSDTGLTNATTFCYNAVAYDDARNESLPSTTECATTTP